MYVLLTPDLDSAFFPQEYKEVTMVICVNKRLYIGYIMSVLCVRDVRSFCYFVLGKFIAFVLGVSVLD